MTHLLKALALLVLSLTIVATAQDGIPRYGVVAPGTAPFYGVVAPGNSQYTTTISSPTYIATTPGYTYYSAHSYIGTTPTHTWVYGTPTTAVHPYCLAVLFAPGVSCDPASGTVYSVTEGATPAAVTLHANCTLQPNQPGYYCDPFTGILSGYPIALNPGTEIWWFSPYAIPVIILQ